MFAPFVHGFGTGGALIVAIGAQNAFVLSQGVRKNHNLIIALICIVCDAVFIYAGVAGVGQVVSKSPSLAQWAAWGGALFLFCYGLRSLRSAVRGESLGASDQSRLTLRTAIVTTLAVTLLNPHFYLDTVVLMGGVSGQLQGQNRLYFWVGAVCASTLWFLSLSLGGQVLAPLFRKQISWRILDSLVCVVMWTLAGSLVLGGVTT